MNASRILVVALGGLAGMAAALVLAPASGRQTRERLWHGARQIGIRAQETAGRARHGLEGGRLRMTELIQTGQTAAREVAGRAQEAAGRAQDIVGKTQDIVGRAPEAVGRIQETAGRMRGARKGSWEPAEHQGVGAVRDAAEAAQKAMQAIEELVRSMQEAIHAARRKLD